MELHNIIYFLVIVRLDFVNVLPRFGYLLAKLSVCDS